MRSDVTIPDGYNYHGGPPWIVGVPDPAHGPGADGRQYHWKCVQGCATEAEARAVALPFSQLGKVIVQFNEWGVREGMAFAYPEGKVRCNHVGEPDTLPCEDCHAEVAWEDQYGTTYRGPSPWPCGCAPAVSCLCHPCHRKREGLPSLEEEVDMDDTDLAEQYGIDSNYRARRSLS